VWDAAPDGKIVKTDVSIAKNYLNDKEMSYMERIVSLYLDYAELQAERQIPMSMEDWAKHFNVESTGVETISKICEGLNISLPEFFTLDCFEKEDKVNGN
jgi:hypothetical protein